jgi:adenylosuccinate synthase
MKDIKVVIGANFGDEGKGLLTDYFAFKTKNGIVVRFNGGAQAGHTVTTPEGKRHVFGHFGSGSFAGLPTYLSSFFVVNPMTFIKELSSLERFGVHPEVYVDGSCFITTPYDMLINQITEMWRGRDRHGSCGLGFNETIERNLSLECYKLSMRDLSDEALAKQKLQAIRNSYVPMRLKCLGIADIPEKYIDLLQSDNLLESFIYDVNTMLQLVKIADISLLSSFTSIIFEGAQGLLLDQAYEYFPHVTRSNTGIKNVRELVKKAGLCEENLEIVYVTRAYSTRHGAGPFPTELPEKPYSKIVDLTNIPNLYQGTLRFGLLDLNSLSETIQQDLRNVEGLKYTQSIAMTCLDQIDEKAKYIVDSKVLSSSIEEFLHRTLEITKAKRCYISYGPTRETLNCVYTELKKTKRQTKRPSGT